MKIGTGITVLALLMSICASNIIYPVSGVVVSVDYEANETIIEDCNGAWWALEGTEHNYTGYDGCASWCEGDVVSLIMYDNGTNDFNEDDIILTARYNGNIDRFMEIAGR